MLRTKTHGTFAPLLAALASVVCAPAPSLAVEPLQLSGAIAGRVTSAGGTPQIGASVILFTRQDRVLQKVLTDDRGEFKFFGLVPDLYSLRVTLSSFIPAIRRDIQVQPGMRSVLAVNLSTLFSSIQLSPPVENGSLMTEDWKWVLRSASATRPVLRFSDQTLAKTTPAPAHSGVFSDTRGVVRLSAGDGPQMTGIGSEADLGTAFALATSLFGSNFLEVSGNLGYGAQTGVPVAAFRTSYSRNLGDGAPEVSVTMRQLLLPGRSGDGVTDVALPMLRTVSTSFDDRAQISDELSVQYGMTLDSVSFLQHLNSISPYVRVVYSLGDRGEIAFAYTSGNARPDLAANSPVDSDLQRDLNSLGMFPRLSLLDGRAKMQRGDEYELSYKRKVGSRVYQLSAYRESVRNAALSLVSSEGMPASDLLPDLFSGNAIFNAGDYHSTGYTATVTQNLGDSASATVIYGTMGTLSAAKGELTSGSTNELRSLIRPERRQALTGRIAFTAPKSKTHVIASYQWMGDSRAVTPGWLYSTQSMRPLPGLNVYIRQPLPSMTFLPWRMEATADLRNLTAQGYLPLTITGGQQVVLVQMPRSVSGGFSFIF